MGRPRKAQTARSGVTVICYLRVSKEDGATKRGLDVQRDVCLQYAASKGFVVVGEAIDNGVSGAKRWQDRAGLFDAFARCVAGEADVILAYNQDRFARKMGVFEDIRDYALIKGVRLETADGRVLTHASDFLNGDVLSLVAAIERRRTSERFMAVRRLRSKRDGRGSGFLPYGYVRAPDGGVGVDEHAAIVIRQLFKLRAKHTYQATADALNAAGYTAPRGGPWLVGQVQRIERNVSLYKTGIRQWDGIIAEMRWPIILGKGAKA